MLQIIIRENNIDEVIREISDAQQAIIESDIPSLKEWIKRSLVENFINKQDSCINKLIAEWTFEGRNDQGIRISSKLEQNGVTSIPTKKDDLCALVITQPNYKTAAQKRREEAEAAVAAAQQLAAQGA